MTDDIILPPNSKAISLTRGKYAIVDDADYDCLSQWKWTYLGTGGGYAYRQIRKKDSCKTILMHRLIMQTPKGMDTDHINGNPLDNRRCNLRICTHSENLWNSKKPNTGKTSKYKGVSYCKEREKWYSYIRANEKTVSLKRHDSEIKAAIAYNEGAIKYFGKYAKLNVIEEEKI